MDVKNEIILYQSDELPERIEVKMEDDTVWLTQKQMALLFDKNIMTINEHIKNVYDEQELEKEPTIRKSLIVQKEGKEMFKERFNLIRHNSTIKLLTINLKKNSYRSIQK